MQEYEQTLLSRRGTVSAILNFSTRCRRPPRITGPACLSRTITKGCRRESARWTLWTLSSWERALDAVDTHTAATAGLHDALADGFYALGRERESSYTVSLSSARGCMMRVQTGARRCA